MREPLASRAGLFFLSLTSDLISPPVCVWLLCLFGSRASVLHLEVMPALFLLNA